MPTPTDNGTTATERRRRRQLKVEPEYDEHSQFERLIAAIDRLEEGLDAIQELLESVIDIDARGEKYVAVRQITDHDG